MKKYNILILVIIILAISCKKDDPDPLPPKAIFTVTPDSGSVETDFHFDASASSDEKDNSSDLKIRWDLDSDGEWDVNWTKTKTLDHKYLQEGTYMASLEVKNSSDLISVFSKTILVANTIINNNVPDIPSNPYPAENATNVSKNVVLTWVCSDPDQDPLVYYVYFGKTDPPAIYNSFNTNSFDPGLLDGSTRYYWKVVAMDSVGGISTSPVWNFVTRN